MSSWGRQTTEKALEVLSLYSFWRVRVEFPGVASTYGVPPNCVLVMQQTGTAFLLHLQACGHCMISQRLLPSLAAYRMLQIVSLGSKHAEHTALLAPQA